MSVKNTVKAINASSVAATSFTGSFQLLTPASGLAQPCFLLRIINNSSKDLFVSYDGINIHDFINHGGEWLLMTQVNSRPGSQVALMPKGQLIYILGDVGGTGDVYLTGYYQSN